MKPGVYWFESNCVDWPVFNGPRMGGWPNGKAPVLKTGMEKSDAGSIPVPSAFLAVSDQLTVISYQFWKGGRMVRCSTANRVWATTCRFESCPFRSGKACLCNTAGLSSGGSTVSYAVYRWVRFPPPLLGQRVGLWAKQVWLKQVQLNFHRRGGNGIRNGFKTRFLGVRVSPPVLG